MTNFETITVKAKDLIDKPSLEDELRMAIGMCIERMAENDNQITELKKSIEQLKAELSEMQGRY